MTIMATGIDLAKNVFAVHGVNGGGVVQLRQPKVARGKLGALIAGLPPGIIGMEACSGAHHWARQFQAHGHTVRLMAPKLVTPYRMSGKRGKNDAADAAAICEAMQRPDRLASCRSRPSSTCCPRASGAPGATACCIRTPSAWPLCCAYWSSRPRLSGPSPSSGRRCAASAVARLRIVLLRTPARPAAPPPMPTPPTDPGGSTGAQA